MAHLDEILSQVTKPGRYTGGEWNSVVKDWEAVDVRVALIYPDIYEIGMSNLGLPILYDLLNRERHTLAERAYAPWTDMEAAMRREGIPLFSLESKRPLKDFDIIGFSLGYELTYTNVLNLLDLAGIPVLAAERTDAHPLIIAGGSCALNPEPLADFIDLFVIGEGEVVVLELLEAFRSGKKGRQPRREFLLQAARIPGIYVPSFYQVDYHDDGTVASIAPTVPEASPRIVRRIVPKLPPPLTRPILPYIEVVHDRGAVEIQRGCTRGCRFCQAGIIYRPLRERPQEEVVTAADGLVRNCGYDEVSLVSLSTSDYSGIESLARTLSQRHQGKNLTLSLPSLRIDTFSIGLADSIRGRKKTGLTFAPEAGTARLRQVINKSVSEEELLRAVAMAQDKGWTGLKLYFMIGLPTETVDDIEGIVELVGKVCRTGRKRGGRQLRVRASVATFVPKPQTPFQWVAQASKEELDSKHQRLRLGLRKAGVHMSWQDPEMSLLEAVLARGDRRLGKVIHRAWQLGCRFDAWSECFAYPQWLRALQETGLSPQFYAHRHRPLDETLPWAHIDCGVSNAFLRREYLRTKTGRETPDCRYGPCSACGLQRWGGSCQEKYEDLVAKAKLAALRQGPS